MRQFFKFILSKLMQVSYSNDNTHIIFYNKLFKLKFKCKNVNWYKSEDDENNIKIYLDYKKTRQAKGVLYTCITNDYDNIEEIKILKYTDKDWDYVCFTDNVEHIKQGQVGIWEIRPLQFSKLDNTRNQRWHKSNPHIIFPNYQKSIWIDGNINLLTNYIFRNADEMKQNIMVPIHHKTKCIYKEYKDVTKQKLDDYKLIKSELEIIKNTKMPKNYGFTETNILIRNHLKPDMIKLQNEWWNFISQYSKRDQLAFMYLIWKYGLKTKDIILNNTRLDCKNFYVLNHQKVKEISK